MENPLTFNEMIDERKERRRRNRTILIFFVRRLIVVVVWMHFYDFDYFWRGKKKNK